MEVWIITQHYWPETVGTARRAQLLAEFLVTHGHKVDVLCGIPNHPSMFQHYGQPHASSHHGVRVHRVPVYRRGRPEIPPPRLIPSSSMPILPMRARLHRGTTYATWNLFGLLKGLPLVKGDGPIVAISPLPTGTLALLLSAASGRPLLFDVQDIWPDAVVRAGLLRSPTLIRSLEVLEEKVYDRARAVVVLSEGFKSALLQKGVPAQKLHVIQNGVDPGPHQEAQRETLRARWGLSSEDVLVAYTGNVGLVQGLEALVEAARSLKHVRQLHFRVVGDGVDLPRLRALVAAEHLERFHLEGALPAEEMPAVLAAADICYLGLRSGAFTPGTVPSKLYEYLAAGRPVVSTVSGGVESVLEEAQAGFSISPDSPVALRIALLELTIAPSLRSEMGQNAVAYVKREASIHAVGQRYEALLYQVYQNRPHSFFH